MDDTIERIREKIDTSLIEHNAIVASHRLMGNIVKEEFHKGTVWGLHLVRLYIDTLDKERT